MLNLDFSVFTSDIFSIYILKGFYFSVMLTAIAAMGGLIFCTILALMRLSSFRFFVLPGDSYVNGMRSIPLIIVLFWFFLLVPSPFYSHMGTLRADYRP